MLLNKAYKANDVLTFKLTSGEEIIARYQAETLTEYQVVKPATLTPTSNGTLGMISTLFSIELNTTTVNLQKTAIAIVAHTKKEFADEYTRATSGIKPASSLEGFNNATGST